MCMILARIFNWLYLKLIIKYVRLAMWCRDKSESLRSRADGFKLPICRHREPIPAGENPFWHDSYHMGTPLVRGWTAMHAGYDRKDDPWPLDYVILVNQRTGQRIYVDLRRCNDANPTVTV